MNEAKYILDGLAILTFFVGAILVIRSQSLKETIKQNKALSEQQAILIETYRERLDLLEQQHIENAKQIGQLQGEINAYKKIPLDNIAKSLKQIATTNTEILKMVKER